MPALEACLLARQVGGGKSRRSTKHTGRGGRPGRVGRSPDASRSNRPPVIPKMPAGRPRAAGEDHKATERQGGRLRDRGNAESGQTVRTRKW